MSERIALVQPHIAAGRSLGIEKSPASIQTLAAQLEGESHEVRMFHEKVSDELIQNLMEFDPRVVGISTMTVNFPEGRKLAEAIKSERENIIIVIGGWHASGCVQAYLKGQERETLEEIVSSGSPFNYLIEGEGEIAMSELVRRISAGEKPDDIKGLVFMGDNGIRINAAERIKDLNVLRDPSWNGLQIDNYRDKRSGALDLSCHFNRACRFNCDFCPTPTLYGRGVRRFSPQRAVGQIESLLTRYKPEVITFTDEDFFASTKWVEELVELLEKRDLHGKYGIEFDTFASINDLRQFEIQGRGELLDRMHRAGFNSFTVGIESFNPQVLRSFNKEKMIHLTMTDDQRLLYKNLSKQEQDKMLVEHYFECVQSAIIFAQRHRILIIGDYIFGNLGESEEEVREGFKKFSNLRDLHIAYLPIFTPFPGTKLWKEAYESGRLIRNKAGKIDWTRFDTSAGAMELGYNMGKIRNELELEFYTSERYHKDMKKAIQTESAKIELFRSRFNYLSSLYPENKLIGDRLAGLK